MKRSGKRVRQILHGTVKLRNAAGLLEVRDAQGCRLELDVEKFHDYLRITVERLPRQRAGRGGGK